jgi:hypothetical protein
MAQGVSTSPAERPQWGSGKAETATEGSNSRSGHTGSTQHRREERAAHSQRYKRASQKARSGEGVGLVCTENGISGDAVWLKRVSSD